MLTKAILRIEEETRKHAHESIERALPAENLAFEAGRRHGVHQGLKLARSILFQILKGDEDDSGSSQGAANRRAG